MPLRNLWSLQPGELLVAEHILGHIPGSAVYFPVRDVGIDLLVTKEGHHHSIQVKESRYYVGKDWHNSWHKVSQNNLVPPAGSRKAVPDVFVFLTYVPNASGKGRPSFDELYLVVPTEELIKRATDKKPSNGVYSFLFSFEDAQVFDIRETPEVDYTMFLNEWSPLS